VTVPRRAAIVDPDPLGLIADIEGRPGPLSEWDLVAKMDLSWDEIVDLFGPPPQAMPLTLRGVTRAWCHISRCCKKT